MIESRIQGVLVRFPDLDEEAPGEREEER